MQRRFFLFEDRLFCHLGIDEEIAALFAGAEIQILVVALQKFERLITRRSITESRFQHGFFELHTLITQTGSPQRTTPVRLITLHSLSDCRLHIDFHQEVHTSTQIQAQIHWLGDVTQPVWCSRHQIQRQCVAIAEGAVENIQTRELRLGIGKPNNQVIAVYIAVELADVSGFQGAGDIVSQGRFQLARACRQLHSGIITVQIGQGVEDGNQCHQAQQEVFPERVFVHEVMQFPVQSDAAGRSPTADSGKTGQCRIQ